MSQDRTLRDRLFSLRRSYEIHHPDSFEMTRINDSSRMRRKSVVPESPFMNEAKNLLREYEDNSILQKGLSGSTILTKLRMLYDHRIKGESIKQLDVEHNNRVDEMSELITFDEDLAYKKPLGQELCDAGVKALGFPLYQFCRFSSFPGFFEANSLDLNIIYALNQDRDRLKQYKKL